MGWLNKLVNFTKEKITVFISFFICTAIILFTPSQYLQIIHIDKFVDKYGYIVGFFFVASGVLICLNVILWIVNFIKQIVKDKRKKEILNKLVELYDRNQLIGGFTSKEDCLSWSTRIAPLLKFNEQYHQTFVTNLDMLSIKFNDMNISATIFHRMINQVEMAIEDLKNELNIND